MKKAFIQKLSIAMASALVITAAAPAQADAAAAMKINRASKVLYLNEDNMTNTADNYDFSIKNKPSNYKTKYTFTWYADDESVVDVAKGGVVTAVATGKTTVHCVVKKKSTGKVYKDLKTVVEVKANAETVTIKNQPEDGKIEVGSTFDFNRTMKAANGGKATDKTEWFVTADEEGTKTTDVATIDKKGVVTVSKTGTFYVTAKTYQSQATKADGYTAESAPVKVTAVNKIKELKAVKSNQLSLTLASPAEYKATDYVLTNVATGARTYVKNVTNKDNVVTLDLFNNLTSGQTYKLTVDGMEQSLDFVKGSVTTIELNDQTIPAGTPTAINYTVYDENGLDITADTTVNFNSNIAFDANKKLTLANGVVAYVKISYFDVNTKKTIESRQATITGSTSATTGILGTTIASTGSDANFSNPSTTIAKGTTGKYLWVQVTDQYGNKKTANYVSGFDATFESLTPEVLVVDAKTGLLTPISVGTAIVKVTSNNISTTVAITVKDAAKETSLDITKKDGSMTESNTVAHQKNYPTVTTRIVDQYGNKFEAGSRDVNYKVVSGSGVLYNPNTGDPLELNNEFTHKDGEVKFTPKAAGTVTFEVTYGSMKQWISVTVTAKNIVTSKYSIEGLTKLNKAKAWGESTAEADSTTLNLFTVNATGDYIDAITGANIKFVITKPNGSTQTVTGGSYELTKDIVKDLAVGTYSVVAYQDNFSVATGSFEVVDTTTAPTVTLSSNTITGAITVDTVKGILNIPSGYELKRFKFVSGNEACVATPADFVEGVAVNGTGDVYLYNFQVEIASTKNGRTYTINTNNYVMLKR